MMAKMFYTLEETKAALSLNEEEIKQLSREGRLREFRDGPRLMFKADQVDNLRAELAGGGDQISLGPSDSGVAIGLADSKSSPLSGSGVSLADTDFGKSPGAGMVKEDTALAADLGLSGTAAGVPSPRPGDTRSGTKVGSRVGVNVFGEEGAPKVDPMAQTAIGSGIQDQINLEGVGSGSGLLDLTRESDDTSLGAELLDEISPGAATGAGRRGTVAGVDSGVAMEAPRAGRSVISQPVYVEAPDALAPAMGWLALFGAIVLIFGIFVLLNYAMGVRPDLVSKMSGPDKMGEGKGVIYLGMMFGGALVAFIIGMIIGKTGGGAARR
jgi:hypothetical protein